MYEVNIEANMVNDEIAQILSEDTSWLQAQWPEVIREAEDAGKNVTGNPQFINYTKGQATIDGFLYNFKFRVPTSN